MRTVENRAVRLSPGCLFAIDEPPRRRYEVLRRQKSDGMTRFAPRCFVYFSPNQKEANAFVSIPFRRIRISPSFTARFYSVSS